SASRTGNGRLGIHVHRNCLQLRANAESDLPGSSIRVSPGRTVFLSFENTRLSPVSPYVGASTNGPQASERRNREKAEFRPRPFFSILLVLLGHKKNILM